MRVPLILGSVLFLLLLPGGAVAQTPAPSLDYKQVPIPSERAKFSLDRGAGQAKIEMDCGGAETTRRCIDALLPVLGVLSGTDGTHVVYATTSVKCGDTAYEVSTGTGTGECTSDGNKVTCTDKGSVVASATCQAGCGNSKGAGSCKTILK